MVMPLMIVVMIMPIFMHMPIRRHILIFYIVHAAHRAFSRLIAAAALAVHGADVGGGILRTLLVRIGFHVVAVVHVAVLMHVLGFVGSGIVIGRIRIAAAGAE